MDKNSLMKWLLVAGAAYLVYRYLQQSGYLKTVAGPLAGDTGPAAYDSQGNVIYYQTGQTGTTEPGIPPTSSGVAVQATAPAAPAAMSLDELRIKLKALMDADAEGGVAVDGVTRTHDFYHYQYWYQKLTGGHDLPPGETLGLDATGRLQLMTFDEFWSLLMDARGAGAAVGYPGLGLLARLASAWS